MDVSVVEEIQYVVWRKLLSAWWWNLCNWDGIAILSKLTIFLDGLCSKPFSLIDTRIFSLLISRIYAIGNKFYKFIMFSA